MWRLHLILSLQVVMIKSMYLPEMPQSPLPLLQEELQRLQAMQVQHIADMQKLQTMPGPQTLQNMPVIQNLQILPGMQQMQHFQDMQQIKHLKDMQQFQAWPELQQLQGVPNLQQLQAISEMQHLQQLQDMHQLQATSGIPMNQIQPIIVLLPGFQNGVDTKNIAPSATKTVKDKKEHKGTVDEDLESVVLEAEEPIPTIEDQKAILLVPNSRISINSIISAIPFLPFEINVPDTIAWMYNGIISIIGQIQNLQSNRLKFKNFEHFGNIREQQLRPVIIIPL